VEGGWQDGGLMSVVSVESEKSLYLQSQFLYAGVDFLKIHAIEHRNWS
jgi:hypothetical protein